MVYYVKSKPKVYIETTVVSYLVARQSPDATLASWQQATRQLWESYADRFEFVVSDIVLDEVREGDPIAAQRRLEVLLPLMKEHPENYTDPILEECYRMKEAFAAKFNSIEELSAYLRARQEERKRQGVKYVSYYKPPEQSGKDT